MAIIGEISACLLDTPIGQLVIGENQSEICLCDFAYRGGPRPVVARRIAADEIVFRETLLLKLARDLLTNYLSGKSEYLELPLKLTGTPFQQRVWAEISKIRYGETITYAALAQSVTGSANGVRAVAGACAANPVVIFIPCHRVIAAADPGGYAGGVAAKKHLLNLEARKLAF